MTATVPATARLLGLLGLLPQGLFLLLVAVDHPRLVFAAQSLAFAYAALILSFLGGLWWGLAATAARPPAWLWIAAVMPSLAAFASFLPWALAGSWPGPSLVLLGGAIMASLAVDRRLVRDGLAPDWWMRLRLPLSAGLGMMTIAIGLLGALR